ncbi:MAG: hypothetical protein NC218_10435 [Acetobacter sp.]|nr:hypothetical protein [Acetobacter sp.]
MQKSITLCQEQAKGVISDFPQWVCKVLSEELWSFELWDIFEKVIGSSTYGSSTMGGPVWILDFRLKTLKKLFPEHPWIVFINQYDTENSERLASGIGNCFSFWAYLFVKKQGLCNVLVAVDNLYKRESVTFYSLISFNRMLSSVLQQGEVEGAPMTMVYDILMSRNSKIKGDDYIWGAYFGHLPESFPNRWSKKNNASWLLLKQDGKDYCRLPYPCPQLISIKENANYAYSPKHFVYQFAKNYAQSVQGWENYLPMVIYDCMELVSMGYVAEDFPECQYPMIQYPPENKDSFELGMSSRMRKPFLDVQIPMISNPEQWHKEFSPKEYWQLIK